MELSASRLGNQVAPDRDPDNAEGAGEQHYSKERRFDDHAKHHHWPRNGHQPRDPSGDDIGAQKRDAQDEQRERQEHDATDTYEHVSNEDDLAGTDEGDHQREPESKGNETEREAHTSSADFRQGSIGTHHERRESERPEEQQAPCDREATVAHQV